MSDSELSEFEPYDCLDDLAADLERYTQSQLNNEEARGLNGQDNPIFHREWKGDKGTIDEREARGKIAIQIRPKRGPDDNSPIDRAELKKMSSRAPSIEERMAKFNTGMQRDFKLQKKTSQSYEDELERIELARKERSRLTSDNFKTVDKREEITNNANRKSSFPSDKVELRIGQNRSGVHKNHESRLSDHSKELRQDLANVGVNSASGRRSKMHSVDGGDDFPVRRKSSQGRKNLSPAVDYQQPHSRLGSAERLDGVKQPHSWLGSDENRVVHRSSGDQVRDRATTLPHYIYSKKPDLRLSSSAKGAAVIKEDIQGPHSLAQQSTGVNAQLPREKVRAAKGGSYFPSQVARSQSSGDEHHITGTVSSGYLQRELKILSTDAGKSPANEQPNKVERGSSRIYSLQNKKRPVIINDFRGVEVSPRHAIRTSRKTERNGEFLGNGGSIVQEKVRTDRSTHNTQRSDNPGVIHANRAYVNISQNAENSLIKSQASRVRKNSLGLLEPRKILSNSGSDRGKLVEKNNNTVWLTDSASGSSEEERTIETDSSTTSSVIDERRRRRLVKRSRKRGLNTRKSQLSQFIDREISAIESQTSDDGNSRASVDDSLNDILSPDEGLGKIDSRESYKRARQIFEKSKPPEPQRINSKNSLVANTRDQQNVPKENGAHTSLKEQTPQFTLIENHTAMSTVHTSRASFINTSLEGKNNVENVKAQRKNSGGTFTGVAKVSKITIPSLQLRSFNTNGRTRYTSDTESYAAPSKISSDPFGFGRKNFRDKASGFSDGEHELTARMEKNEDLLEDQSIDDHLFGYERKSYTLPRNIGRKKMKESPFQLNLPGKKRRDGIDMQCNSQSSIEDVSVKSFPLSMKDLSPSRIQSRSAGNICIDSMVGYGTVHENPYGQSTDSPLDIDNSFPSSLSAHNDKIDDSSSMPELTKACSNMSESFSADDKDVTEEVLSPVEASVSNPFLVELLAPPDSFKDSPDEQVSEELVEEKVEETVESQALLAKEVTPLSMINDSIANEASEILEKMRGRQPASESVDLDKGHDRAGSPRRRPSYVKAQVSDSILWTGSKSVMQQEIVGGKVIEEPSEMAVEEQSLVNVADGEKETADQRKNKKLRPRIPPTLGPVKPVYDDILAIAALGKEPPSPENADQSQSVDNYSLKETSLAEDERASVVGEKRSEKSEIVKRRPRAILAATPMLEEIPEEKSHGSGSDTNSVRATEDSQRAKKNKKQALLGELDLAEGRDSPKTDRSDKAETGYFSSSLSSITNQLNSVDDMVASGSPVFNVENFSDGDAFEQSRMLNFFTSEKAGSEMRSRSDPMPATIANESPSFSPSLDAQEIDPKWSSNSEPNLSRANLTPLVEPKRTISTQEVLKTDEPKARKGSTESGDSLRSPVGSPFEQPAFPQQRSDSQKPFSPRPSDQQSPVALVVPQQKQKHDMRKHVLQNLLDTENSYVQNLKFLETVYYKPLKKSEGGAIIESGQVDEIFFQIPEILLNHEYFLEQLNNRAKTWSDKQIIGDIFVSSFTQCLLMDAYSSFINNFLQARATVRLASMRPAFAKFLEQRCKEHKEKLTLQDLLIQPVQRIPRYVLILKDLLKHTEVKHPDYGRLQHALEQIKTLAERMNKGEMEADQAEKEAEKIRDVEATIEGVSDLVTANRKYLRQDLSAEIKGVITKKDRCLFLFSDLLVCATVRKKTNTLRRGSLGLFSGQSATDFNRYKLLWKAPLDATELKAPLAGDKQAERIDDDIATLRKIRAMADSLVTPHPGLDSSVREILLDLERQASEINSLARVELQVQTDEGTETYVFVLLSAEVRSSWEAVYEDAKQKLAYATHSFPPEFQSPLPVDKKRSGMQFTCAAPSRVTTIGDISDPAGGDIWVCNSDGYVGHFCPVSMVPEAQSRACVTVCSSRIQCIAPVPGSKLISTNKPRSSDSRKVLSANETKSHKKSSKSSKMSSPSSLKSKKSFPSESDDDDQAPGPEDIISFDTTDEEDNGMDSHFIGGPTTFGGRMSPDGSSLGTVESVEGIDCSSSDDQSYRSGNESSDGEEQPINRRIGVQMDNSLRKGSQGLNQKAGLEDFLTAELDENPTMWLGTQDGYIHVYQSTSNIRKSKTKMLLGPVVNAILYQDNKVFVALASGELRVYKRDQGNGWEVNSPQSLQVGRNGASISCIAAAAGRIWCGCQNHVVLVNASTLKTESTIVVSQDSHRSVYLIVSSGLGVWISLQSSAVVRLYHATSFENLADIDVAPAVHKMLAGADAIIRQHKAACLRITALLACKDLLWIGTSAGVILTNPLPAIKVNTSSLRSAPGPTGSPHGHTGHVRFLTTVEVPKSQFKGKGPLSPEINSNRPTSPPTSRTKKVIDTVSRSDDSLKNVTLVISGGDGYEDFRTSATSESVGRDDSTNHLLIWRV